MLVIEFDRDQIDARGLLEAIYKRDMIAVDPNLRPTISNPALAHIQERLCLLNGQLRAFFASRLIA